MRERSQHRDLKKTLFVLTNTLTIFYNSINISFHFLLYFLLPSTVLIAFDTPKSTNITKKNLKLDYFFSDNVTMKKSNKPNIGAGFILLLVAAFFTLTILTQFIDLGALENPNFNFLNKLGQILSKAYGYSSILIPVFIFIAAISCFTSRWNGKKSMRLITAIIPFFTAVGTEKFCDSIQASSYDDFTTIKLTLAVLIGIMLIVIEILLAGIIGEKLFNSKKSNAVINQDSDSSEEKENSISEQTSLSDDNDSFEENPDSENYNSPATDSQEEYIPPKDDPFAHVFDEEPETSVNEQESTSSESENTVAPENSENPGAFITQEEYAALAFTDEDLNESEEETDTDAKTESYSAKESYAETESYSAEESYADTESYSAEQPDTASETDSEEETETEQTDSYSAYKSPYGNDEQDYNSNSEELYSEPKDDFEDPESQITDFDFTPQKEETSEQFNEAETEPSEEPTNEQAYTPEEAAKELDEAFEQAANDFEVSLNESIAEDDFSPDTLSEDFFDIDPTTEESKIEETDYSEEDDSYNENNSVEEEADHSEETDLSEEINTSDERDISEESAPTRFDLEPSGFGIASDVFADMAADAKDELENGTPYKPEESIYAGEKASDDSESDSELNTELDSESRADQTDEDQEISVLVPSAEKNIFESQEPKRTTIATDNSPKTNRVAPKKPYIVPTDLLEEYEDDQYWIIDDATNQDALKLKETLNQFGISAEVIGVKKGPVVTMFEIAPAPGVKLSRIVGLQDNIALSLAASSVRIVAPIPGKAAVGIEIPNKKRSIVSFREMIEQDLPEFKKMAIPVILGKDILGKSQIIDIAKTPHLLIAGATGAGKSVCVNSLILSILYKRSPKEVKMILVDPKVVELKLYNDIPHLLTPVITEPKKAIQALQYCLCEMERRYALLDGMGVRDISNYNKRIQERNICTEKLPYIVVIIDEFADLMATSGRDLESIVARLTAMSRAVGIHLVLATQRPSVNVITGLIKANIPSRIAFMVSSRTDSNIIIDSVGAEKLLGKGDMLYASAVDPYPVRIQGTFESDNDVEAVVDFVKTLGEPEYIDDEIFVEDEEDENGGGTGLFNDGSGDPLYEQALDIVIQSGKASASYLQRRLSIGYNRAARLVEEMEERGIVGPANGSKPREIIHVPS